jgi:hypothetical protein
MEGSARPDKGRWGKALRAALLSLFAAAAWAQQVQISDSRYPGINMDLSQKGALCNVCGEIRSIREINVGLPQNAAADNRESDHAPGSNLEHWRVVGNVLTLPLGGGKDDGPRVGSAGTPEMNTRFAESSFEINVVMDNGDHRTINRRDGWKFQIGDRVTMRSGEMELMYPR